jgi:F0F1-type ATP synthase assembly protein I
VGSKSTVWKYLVWVTALSASLAGPIALSVLCAYWLQQRFAVGGWVMPVAIFLGLGGAAVNLMKFFRFMQKESEKGREDKDGRF